MNLVGKIVGGSMLLLMLGAPAMACLVPDAQLSQAEKACCRDMDGQCGKMDMPSRHSCCQTSVTPPQSAMLKTAPIFKVSPVDLGFDPVTVISAPEKAVASHPTIRAWRHPPPVDAPTIEILRI